MWRLFSHQAKRHGYTSFGQDKFNCSGYSAIEDFNLGFSNTDYNRLMNGVDKHVGPGSNWVHAIGGSKGGLEATTIPPATTTPSKPTARSKFRDARAKSKSGTGTESELVAKSELGLVSVATLDMSVFDYRGKSKSYSIGQNQIQSILMPVSLSGWVPQFHKNLTWTDRLDLIDKRLSIQAIAGVGSGGHHLYHTPASSTRPLAISSDVFISASSPSVSQERHKSPGKRGSGDMMSRLKSQTSSKL